MRALIVEDEPQVAAFIAAELGRMGFTVDQAADGLEGIRQAQEHRYAIILLDWMLPKRNGIEVCKAIRTSDPHVPILMLTALDGVEEQVKGLGAGADDYLAKPFDIAVLLARVNALIRRTQGRGTDKLLVCGDLVMDHEAKRVTRADQEIRLTAREYALLHHLLTHQGRVLDRATILDQVWDTSFETESNVVDVYINMLRRKVDKPFGRPLIHTVTGMGYVLRNDRP
ncbi:MAG: response regulator transcription factor [Flavobacteriales bacterium]|jgi:DNA-binding response OmpR family regulator|nr:MAG: response regulator transcription factor [Flavobacteriales bacterium]